MILYMETINGIEYYNCKPTKLYSPSRKYKMTLIIDDNLDTCKRVLTRISDNKIIYEHDVDDSPDPLNRFVTIKGQEWWFGGRNYILKLFINLDTEQIFDDPNNIEYSKYYNNGVAFIWYSIIDISPDENKILVDGCWWASPYECRLYDISDLSKGFVPHDPYENYEGDEGDEEFNYDREKYYMPMKLNYNYKFIDNNTIGTYDNNVLIKSVVIN